jgi:hypothetical protein
VLPEQGAIGVLGYFDLRAFTALLLRDPPFRSNSPRNIREGFSAEQPVSHWSARATSSWRCGSRSSVFRLLRGPASGGGADFRWRNAVSPQRFPTVGMPFGAVVTAQATDASKPTERLKGCRTPSPRGSQRLPGYRDGGRADVRRYE